MNDSTTSASASPSRSRTCASSIRSGAADSSWSSIDSASRMPPAASRAMRWIAAGSASRPSAARMRVELALDLRDGQPPDVVALEARQDRRREERRLGRGEHEDDEVGRLLDRLEERVPGVLGDLVRLVEDVDLASELARRVRQALAQVADVVDAAVARGVDLDQVEGRALADRDAGRARVAGVAVLEVRAVDGLGQDPGERRLARAARPDEQDGMADPLGSDGVAQRLDDGLLADDLAEGLGTPAAVESLVRDGRGHDLLRSGRTGVGYCRAPSVDLDVARAHRDVRLGPGRSAAPDDDRLVLLPSGPDTVRGSPLRGTRSSTSHVGRRSRTETSGGDFSPAIADCRYRAPLVPRLARLRKDTPPRSFERPCVRCRLAPLPAIGQRVQTSRSWAKATCAGSSAFRRSTERS